MIYLWSDPHLGHENLACRFTLPDGRPARPFESVEHMNRTILDRYRAVVGPDDTVWCIGDLVFRPTNDLIHAIRSLPGTRYLILGNHDRESVNKYTAMGFTKIRGAWGTKRLLITHYPVHPRSVNRDKVNVHGHIHTVCYDGPYINVCVEQTNYYPVALDDVEAQATRLLEALRDEDQDRFQQGGRLGPAGGGVGAHGSAVAEAGGREESHRDRAGQGPAAGGGGRHGEGSGR